MHKSGRCNSNISNQNRFYQPLPTFYSVSYVLYQDFENIRPVEFNSCPKWNVPRERYTFECGMVYGSLFDTVALSLAIE